MEVNVPRNGVKENVALEEKEINAKNHVAVMLEHTRGQGKRGKSRRMQGGAGARSFALQCGDVRAVDREGRLGIQWFDGAIKDKTVGQYALERGFT